MVLFLFVFLTYLHVVLLKFRSGELVDAKFDFASNEYPHCILLMDPATPKKYLKKYDDDNIITFFQVFLIFWVAGSVKSMKCGYSLDAELNSASNEVSRSEFE